ncbi:MAG: hypothetical protein QNJ47_05055 [Nostocaceae cyanobacterium]|nr:hypothetical protein [Nostocaceae cyanobacterium]
MQSITVNQTSNAASATRFILTVTNPKGTVFKKKIKDSSQLPTEQKCEISEGAVVGIKHYIEADNNHYLVNFSVELGSQQYNTWYVYIPHVSINQKWPN